MGGRGWGEWNMKINNRNKFLAQYRKLSVVITHLKCHFFLWCRICSIGRKYHFNSIFVSVARTYLKCQFHPHVGSLAKHKITSFYVYILLYYWVYSICYYVVETLNNILICYHQGLLYKLRCPWLSCMFYFRLFIYKQKIII